MGERGSFYRLGSAEREKDSIVHSSGRPVSVAKTSEIRSYPFSVVRARMLLTTYWSHIR
jgi:hypothetical protein